MSIPDNKIKETKKLQIQNNNNDKNSEEVILKKINYLLENCNFNEDNDNDKYKKEIHNLKKLFKSNLNNIGFINSVLYSIKRHIHSSSLDLYQKQNILCLITNIVELSPSQFYNNTDAILSLYQYFFTEEYSQLFSLISENFGGLIKIELSLLNNFQPQKINYNSVLLVYNKYKSFCINNINSNSTPFRICGTLCLTSFIENCSFIYNTNEKLKKLFDILMKQLDIYKEVGILEVLNCLTSLIFCCEIQYMPFAKLTVRKILNICSNPEWIVRKFALNIICTLMYYFQDQIYPLKDIILPKLKFLKNEKSSEIKELYEQINNNFIEAEKNNKDNKVSENNYLNIDDISLERSNKNINNEKKYFYTDKNYIYRNILTKRDSSKNLKKEKKYNFSFIKKHFIFKNKVLPHNSKAGASNENKSSKNVSYNPTRKSSYVLKRNKKIIQNLIQKKSSSSTFKNKSIQKIDVPKNIKIKINFNFNNSPLNSNKIRKFETVKDKIKGKSKLKEDKILQIKSIRNRKIYGFKSQKTFNYISKNNSISINNRNINNDITINNGYTNIIKEKNSFNKIIKNKKKINLSKGTKILAKTKINKNIINKNSKLNLEDEFIKYKQHTRKIILELKNKVDELQKIIYGYENESKNREIIKDFVKSKEFINAFNLAIKSNKVNNIYYVLKKYNLYINENIENKCLLTSEILSEIINILSKNIYLFDNLSYVITFIKYNIFEKKIKIDYHTSKLLEGVLIELFNKRKDLYISESDVNNIKCLLDYIQ